MASIEGPIYYILRSGFSDPNAYELSKWDSLYPKRPRDMYVMNLPDRANRFVYCSCPSSKRPCKHYDIAKALLNATSDKILLPQLIYSGGNVLVTKDTRFGP